MSSVQEDLMNFSNETKVKDIALATPSARLILERAGVDYCCGGGESLHEACLHAEASAEEILRRLHENSEQVSTGDGEWLSAPLCDLERHIRVKHHRYVREALARIHPQLEKVALKHGENHSEIREINQLFKEVGREMTMHMQKEEQILFPYIVALEQSANGNQPLEPPFFGPVRNPVAAMMKEHDAAGELIKQIRKVSCNYAAPSDACTSYQALYQDLQEFERDLHQHVHLENNILFPRAVELETAAVHQG